MWSIYEYMDLYEHAHRLHPFDNRAASHYVKLSLYKIIDAIDEETNGDNVSPDVLKLCSDYEKSLRNSLRSTIQCLKILDEMQTITEKK